MLFTQFMQYTRLISRQASIEYVRYLQDCIEKLKAQRVPPTSTEMEGLANASTYGSYSPEQQFQPRRHSFPEEEEEEEEDEEEEHSPDVDMTGSDAGLSPAFTTRPSSSTAQAHQPSVSPALVAQDAAASVRRHDTFVPVAAEHHRHYSYSAVTSPAIGPGWGGGSGSGSGGVGYAPSNHSVAGSTLTSPALGPIQERDLDQEATAALLMLNTDRRGTVGSGSGKGGSGRGMSVRDLLSA